MKITKKKIIILVAMIILVATISVFVITKPNQNKSTINEVKLNQIEDDEILEENNEEQIKDKDKLEEVVDEKLEENTSNNQDNNANSNSDVNTKQEQSTNKTITNSSKSGSTTKSDSSNQKSSSSNSSSSNKSNNKETSNNTTNNANTNSNQSSGVTNNNSNSQANQKEEVKTNNDNLVNTSHLDYSTHKGRIDCTDSNKCMDDSLKIYFKYKQCISNVFYVEVMANNGTILGYFTEYVFKDSSYSTYDECQKVGNEIKNLLSDRVTSYQCDSSNKLRINTDY